MSDAAHLGALAELVGRFAGIQIQPPKHWYLEGRVKLRMERAGVASLGEYVELVRQDRGRAELGLLVEALRVGETRFFRHGAQVTALRRVVIPDIEGRRIESGQRVIRAWSAGCATGEEPYTVAMLLDDALPSARGFRHEVLATDISEDALAVAEAGRFDGLALRTVPLHLRGRYFVEDGEAFRVSDRLRAIVRFERKNLQDPIYPRGFDLILCRNVLIYFDRRGRDRVIDRLTDCLVPGGYLFLGYSESLRGFEDRFDVVRTDEGRLYRTRLADAPAPRPSREPGATPTPAVRVGDNVKATPAVRPRRVTTPWPPADALPPPTPPPVPLEVVRIDGHFGDDRQSDLATLLQPALAGRSPAVAIDLERAELLGDGAARVLLRARRVLEAENRALVFICGRPGVVRWIRRHALDGGLPIAADAEDARRIATAQGRRA